MSEKNYAENPKKVFGELGEKYDEEGYKIAKQIRLANRELDRQLNVKRTSGNYRKNG